MSLRKIKYILFISTLFYAGNVCGQNALPKYWIEFTNKNNTPYTLEQPEAFLSGRSLERRYKQQIALTTDDLPVDPVYLESLRAMGINIINVSRWFNGAIIELNDTSLMSELSEIPFIKYPPLLVKPAIPDKSVGISSSKLDLNSDSSGILYGPSLNQIEMLEGSILHDGGFRGEGLLIAILDAGFTNANVISSLQDIWKDNRVLEMRDFVKDSTEFFNSHSHGTRVFSIIGGNEPGVLYGSAPEADFLLIRTEDGASEYLIEEYNWICGVEFADSMGADVINSSLGYSIFDDSLQNHTYQDMNGYSTPISIAAQKAASKGMVVVSSAGNEGNGSWHYITAPADAKDVLSVGATDNFGEITSFSSRGPSYDGRIKPDVCAQGYQTVSQHPNNSFVYCSGTSCSSPVIAGMVACLWQARPHESSQNIVEYLKRSSSQYLNPDEFYGYGIPDFIKTSVILNKKEESPSDEDISLLVFPNPASEVVFLYIETGSVSSYEEIAIYISDLQGRIIKEERHLLQGESSLLKIKDISEMPIGVYRISTVVDGKKISALFSKFQ